MKYETYQHSVIVARIRIVVVLIGYNIISVN
jgi:hypothetical protein